MAESSSSEHPDDPYYYGSRWCPVHLPDGRVKLKEIPLTPEDFLDPQLGDQFVQAYWHGVHVACLFVQVLDHYKSSPDVLVSSRLKMRWGIPGLPEPDPDIAVIRGVRDKEAERQSFLVQEERVRPCLVVEVASDTPEFRSKDYNEKVSIYESAGVQEYLILEPLYTGEGFSRMTGYRLDAQGRYGAAEPDQRDFFSGTTGLWFRLTPDGQKLYLVDVGKGKCLETHGEAKARADSEAETRRQLEAEIARLREDLERFKRTGD